MNWLHKLAYALLWIGGLNWGLIALWDYNLVESVGLSSGAVQTVYVLVGVSALYTLLTHKDHCKECVEGK